MDGKRIPKAGGGGGWALGLGEHWRARVSKTMESRDRCWRLTSDCRTHNVTHTSLHTHIYIHTHTHTSTHTSLYTHTHTSLYTHMHTHIYTHTHGGAFWWKLK